MAARPTAAERRSLPRTALIPLIIACALFMENMDSTVLATSLPQIAAAFGESPVRLSFAITAYLFSLAVFIPISGWVADRYGARTVFRRGDRGVPRRLDPVRAEQLVAGAGCSAAAARCSVGR